MSDYLKRLAEALKKREAPMGPDAWDWQQFADTSPAGSVNAPGGISQPQERDRPQRLGKLLAGASMLPGPSGDLLGPLSDAYMYATEPESRTPGNFALSALGALPFVPSIAGGKIADAMSDAKKIDDYGISHRPMTEEGGASLLHDLLPAFGDDIYSKNALQFFGSGDPRESSVVSLLRKLRGNPDGTVTIYRGVPADAADDINPGDWVTLHEGVAKDYGPKVLKKKVRAKDVTSWEDSLLEFGFYPKD
jgi:hypothetical protein